MSEIEKMYRNVLGYVCNMPDIDCFHECEKCDSYITFFAEKQIELIKWLARKDYGNYAESLLISIRDGYNYLSVGITTDFGSECFYEDFTFNNKQFDEAIAGLINKLWQSLTEEEKQQVKGILE